jgi:hypothetical protein
VSSRKSELAEIYTEAKMVEAAYVAIQQATTPAQTTPPYPAKLAALVARLARLVEREEDVKIGP